MKASTERYAGGGIIMLVDRRPGEVTKFVDLPPELGGDQPPAMVVDQEPSDMMLDNAEEAEMPEPFEVCSLCSKVNYRFTDRIRSILSNHKH
jgi:hypothetical protein